MANIDNLNFEVILKDDEFNAKIGKDIEAAKGLNVALSSLLEVKAKTSQKVKISVDTKEAIGSLERLNAYFKELEKADASKVGAKLDVRPQVEQALLRLRQLEEEIEVINELRVEQGGGEDLAIELRRAQEEANNLLAVIAELRKAEKDLNSPDKFKSFVRGLTEQTMEMKQLIEYYKAEEKASEEAAKEKAKEEKERQKNAKAIEKERRAMADGVFKEHIQDLTRANPTLKQMSAYYRELERETAKTANAAKGAALHQDRLNQKLKRTSRIASEVKSAMTGIFSIYAARELVSSLVRITGEFEMQKTTLAAMLVDLNASEKVITKIQKLAVESPFRFKELTTYAKQLSAFSVPAEELYNTTKMLADISAGLGVGMDRIVLAYGQVRSAAFLRGQEVRQFTEAGIPILDELAKQFTELEGRAVSTGEVFDKISARLVPFEMVAKVFKDMTAEGGKFYQMQEIQAETLKGKISNLKDAYEMMLNEIGEANSDKLKAGVDMLRKLMNNWQAIGGQIMDLIKLFGAYKAAVAVLAISDTIAKFGGLAKALKATAAAQKILNSALLTNPYIAVGTAITAVALAIQRQRKEIDATTAAQNRYNARVRELAKIDNERKNKIQSLINVIQDETEATVEREAALLSLKNAYPKIFEQYDLESLKLADILSIKKQIAEEDAKQKRLSARAGIEAQEGRIKALVGRGAGHSYKNAAWNDLYAMEKDYLSTYVIPDMVSGLKTMTDEALKTALNEAFIKSQYDFRGIELIEDIPTTSDFYKELYAAIQSEITKRQNTKLVDGWRKKVQDALTKLSLNKDKSFGLWATETTESVAYVDELVKRYKELNREIELVSSFDSAQAANLRLNVQAIEAVAKALNLDLNALVEGNKKTKESSNDMLKTFEAYKKFLDQWKAMDFNLSGKGVYFDLSKSASDLNNEYAKIDQKRLKGLEMLKEAQLGDEKAKAKIIEEYGQEVWDAYVSNGSKAIDELVKKEREAARLTAFEKSRDLAKKYVSEMDIDLSGLQRMSAAQIKESLKELQEEIDKVEKDSGDALVAAFAGINEGKVAEDAYAEWQMLVEALKLLKKQAEETQETLDKKNWKNAVKGAEMLSKGISKIGEDLASLGSSIENGTLERLGNRLSDVGDLAGTVANNFKIIVDEVGDLEKLYDVKWNELSSAAQGGVVGIVIGALTYLYNSWSDAINGAIEHQKMLNDASREYAQIQNDIRREKFTDIFGTDEIALAAENTKILNEANEQYLADLEAINKVKLQGYKHRGGGREGIKKQSLADMLGSISEMQGWSLYDAEGMLDFKAIEAYYDTFKDSLTKKQRKLVESLIESGNAYTDAAAQQAEYITNLYSSAADDIASKMVDAFLESGDAATEFGDVAKSVAREMAIDLLKSVLLKPILDEYGAAMEYIMGQSNVSNEDKIKELVKYFDSMLTAVSQVSEDATEMLKPILGQYVGMGSEEASSLADGIKGSITEDTAGLLASYINAMRADLSAVRQFQAQHLPIISQSMPTIMDHLARIQANTLNIASSNQSMLNEIISMNERFADIIDSGNNGSAIKVLM